MEDKGSKGGRARKTTAKNPAGTTARTAVSRPSATAKEPPAKKPPAPRKAAARQAPDKSVATAAERAEMVRMAAYFRAERRGFAAGYEIEDWLAAEAEVAEKLGPAPAGDSDKPAKRKP